MGIFDSLFKKPNFSTQTGDGRTEKKEEFFGEKYYESYSDTGKIRTEEKKELFGEKYYESYSDAGKIKTKEQIDFFGNKYYEIYSDKTIGTGKVKKETSIFGIECYKVYDENDNYLGECDSPVSANAIYSEYITYTNNQNKSNRHNEDNRYDKDNRYDEDDGYDEDDEYDEYDGYYEDGEDGEDDKDEKDDEYNSYDNSEEDYDYINYINYSIDSLDKSSNQLESMEEVAICNVLGWRKILIPKHLEKQLKDKLKFDACEKINDFISLDAEVFSCRDKRYYVNFYGITFTLPMEDVENRVSKIYLPNKYPQILDLKNENLYVIHCGCKYKLLYFNYEENKFGCKIVSSVYQTNYNTIEKKVFDDNVYNKRFVFFFEDYTNIWSNKECITDDNYVETMYVKFIGLIKKGFPLSLLDVSQKLVQNILYTIEKSS